MHILLPQLTAPQIRCHRTTRQSRAQLRRPRRPIGTLAELLTPLRSLGGVARPTHASSLTGRISPHREYVWAESTLDDVKRIRK